MNKKIILASASPRRRELLSQIGLDFEVVVSETEEKITSTERCGRSLQVVMPVRFRITVPTERRKVVMSAIRNRKVEQLL